MYNSTSSRGNIDQAGDPDLGGWRPIIQVTSRPKGAYTAIGAGSLQVLPLERQSHEPTLTQILSGLAAKISTLNLQRALQVMAARLKEVA